MRYKKYFKETLRKRNSPFVLNTTTRISWYKTTAKTHLAVG